MLIIVPNTIKCSLEPDDAFSCGWYLHGKLEDMVGFDLARPINLVSMGYTKDTIDYAVVRGNTVEGVRSENPRHIIHINSIIPVKCFSVEEPCVGYFWTIDMEDIIYRGNKYPNWMQRGLVCLKSDAQARNWARQKFQEKSVCL